jgi:KUP system potassium uptake protein
VALTTLFLIVDLAFFGANLLKVPHGGWFPLLVAGLVFLLMSSWKKGRVRLSALVQENTLPLDLFLKDIAARKPHRVPGAAVFLTSVPGGAPPVLLHHLKHNKVLHQTVMLMSIMTEEIPQVDEADRIRCRELGEGFYEIIAKFGFMETPDIPSALTSLGRVGPADGGIVIKPMETTYYLGRETLIPMGKSRGAPSPATRVEMMPKWRKKLFILMSRNAQPATAFFGLPPNRVVELGAQLQF